MAKEIPKLTDIREVLYLSSTSDGWSSFMYDVNHVWYLGLFYGGYLLDTFSFFTSWTYLFKYCILQELIDQIYYYIT